MTSFTDLTKQVHALNDLILSDMVYVPDNTTEAAADFSKHLLITKSWFSCISSVNKKRYLLALLQDVRSAWTLSLLLKSIWNCRPKDAVMSISERGGWLSCYDQVPMDHNRTALPVKTLAITMKSDLDWFLSLAPEPQAQVLSELLSIAGGSAMWEVFRLAQTLYERYQEQILQSLHECIIVSDTNESKSNARTNTNKKQSNMEQPTSETTATPEPTVTTEPEDTTAAPAATTSSSPGQKNLEANLATWNATIKTMRDSLKLEEFEMTFHDGTKKKIWKVNRPKPDVVATVDFLQLLPSAVGKKILSFLPRLRLSEYASVNKYWEYLVDEYNLEIIARAKINADIDRLEQIVITNDENMFSSQFIAGKELAKSAFSSIVNTTTVQPITSNKLHQTIENSIGVCSRRFSDELHKPKMVQKPIHNMKEFYERLERRGAVDDNIWQWCENIITLTAKQKPDEKKKKKTIQQLSKPEVVKGILTMDNTHFPCPLMKFSLVVPLKLPLYKDPAEIKSKKKPRSPISDASLTYTRKEAVRRYSLWTRNVSSLYPVFKIPSYHFPFN